MKPPLLAAAIPLPVGDWDPAGACLCGQCGCVRDAVYGLAVVCVNNRSAMLDNEYANQKLGFQIPKKSGFQGRSTHPKLEHYTRPKRSLKSSSSPPLSLSLPSVSNSS